MNTVQLYNKISKKSTKFECKLKQHSIIAVQCNTCINNQIDNQKAIGVRT